jgi:hypothetical protein
MFLKTNHHLVGKISVLYKSSYCVNIPLSSQQSHHQQLVNPLVVYEEPVLEGGRWSEAGMKIQRFQWLISDGPLNPSNSQDISEVNSSLLFNHFVFYHYYY